MCKFSMYNWRINCWSNGFGPRNNIGTWDWFWSQTNSCFSNTYDHRQRQCAARLAGCCQVKIMYFGSGCEKMPEWHPLHTPPGLCRHRVNSFWVGPIHVIVAYTGLRTVWSHSRTWSLTFSKNARYQNIEFDLLTLYVFGPFFWTPNIGIAVM